MRGGRPGRAGVTLQHAEDAMQRRAILYDRQADNHYDTISAWIKATRGSDPDASLYYLAVMLEGGEDPRFIVRRMVILASEDVGNADPQALVGGDRRGGRGRARRPARGGVRARAGGDLPVARAQVRRGQARDRGRPRVHPRARRQAPPGYLRSACAPAASTTTRTPGPAISHPRSCCRRPSRASASTSPTTPRRSSATASRRSGRPAEALLDRARRPPEHPVRPPTRRVRGEGRVLRCPHARPGLCRQGVRLPAPQGAL